MTANLVTGFSPVQEIIPKSAAVSGQSSEADFSNVLKANTNKNYESDDKNVVENKAGEKSVKDDVKSTDAQVTDTDKKAETKATKEVSEAKEADKISEKDSNVPDEEVMEAVAEVVATMIADIAEALDVSVEDVKAAIETLGIETEQVLDSSVIPKLAVELTDATDVSEIITNEELFADVKALMETSDRLVKELASELNMTVDNLKEMLSNKTQEVVVANKEDSQVVVGKEDSIDFAPAPQLTYVPEVNTAALKNESGHTDSRQHGRGSESNTNENVNFAQSVVENIREAVQEISNETHVSYSSGVSMEDIMEQVTNNLKMTMKNDITEMEMQLHPASLGNIRVQVIARDGVITANFTTQNEQVRQALESQVVQLREQMNEQGIKVEAVEVTVASHAFDRNLNEEGERGQNQGETDAKRKKTRGINLGEIDNFDDMDEEDKVTADMMARAGNTVDYLA